MFSRIKMMSPYHTYNNVPFSSAWSDNTGSEDGEGGISVPGPLGSPHSNPFVAQPGTAALVVAGNGVAAVSPATPTLPIAVPPVGEPGVPSIPVPAAVTRPLTDPQLFGSFEACRILLANQAKERFFPIKLEFELLNLLRRSDNWRGGDDIHNPVPCIY